MANYLVAERPRTQASVTVLNFKKHVSGSLRGFVDVHVRPYRLKVLGVTIHETNGKRWASLPAAPRLDRERRAVIDDRGKVAYSPVLSWDSDTVRYAFSDAVVEAVLAFDPSAFDGEVHP